MRLPPGSDPEARSRGRKVPRCPGGGSVIGSHVSGPGLELLTRFVTDDGVSVLAVTADTMRKSTESRSRSRLRTYIRGWRMPVEVSPRPQSTHPGPGWRNAQVAVCAGTGGDGICAARHLANHGGDLRRVSHVYLPGCALGPRLNQRRDARRCGSGHHHYHVCPSKLGLVSLSAVSSG